ncbi:MAG: hypothetical protein Q8K58_04590 [Acidimicrobiales bacterium]|nr:hypothetical protein [Acidimicrobiales bacterium]
MSSPGPPRGRTALAALVVTAAVTSGCEDVPITRPAPELTDVETLAIGVAVGMAGLVAIGLLLHLLERRQPARRRRVAAAAVFSAVAVAGLGTTVWLLALQVRTDQILDGGTCRVMPERELPAQIVQLSCDTSVDALSPVTVAAVLVIILPVVAVAILCAADVLHRVRPWWPALFATAGALGLAAGALLSSVDSAGDRQVALFAGAALLLGATAAACWYELVHAPRHARPPAWR